MITHRLLLLSAAILLLVPVGIFHGPKVRFRSIRREWTGHWRQILILGLHAVDFCRAALGGWLLEIALPDSATTSLPTITAPVVKAGVVLSAVLLQTLICREPASLNAPFAFLAGLLGGLYSPVVAGFTLVFSAVVAGGSRTPIAFFPALAVFLTIFGFFFGGMKLSLDQITGAVAFLLPWLWSLLFSRPLVTSYRAKRTDDPLNPIVMPKR